MSQRQLPWRLSACFAAGLLAACGGGDAVAPLQVLSASEMCERLAGNAQVPGDVTTVYHAAGTRRPGNAATGDPLGGHCVLKGYMDRRTGVDGNSYAIGYELSLPDDWNGRLLYIGGGGNDGSLRDTSLSASISGGTPSPLGQGFAVVSTDAGHQGPTAASFGFDPQARIDHAYNAHDKTAQAAKQVIAVRYGQQPRHAYFAGCSGGGRQGMMFSQRFPDYFDGIIVGAPAMRVSSGATVAAMWNHIKFTAIAPDNGGGKILSQAFSNADLSLLADAINTSCDAADGVVDGLVSTRPGTCNFDPAVLQCAGAKTATCLTAAQVGALKDVFGGPRNSAGQALYAGQPWDPGVRGPGWRAWTLGTSTTATPNSAYAALMSDALKHEFFTPPDPTFDILTFDFDTDPQRMEEFSKVYDTYRDTTLSAYQASGGKFMLVHGMSDPIFSALESQAYYEQLAANNGGMAAVQDWARAYYVPGMNHCSGGPATDTFDAIQAMVDWVEKGTAPDRIQAWARPNNAYFPNRTRPLCPYPKYARYNGSGSIEDAANFTCVQ
jgi:feruloyl esterase